MCISSLTRMIATPLLWRTLWFALKPSLSTACARGVTRRFSGEMAVVYQLKTLPGQSKERMRMCQRWGGRWAYNMHKQMPQQLLECTQSHCWRFPTPLGAHSSAEMHKHRCFSDRVSQRVQKQKPPLNIDGCHMLPLVTFQFIVNCSMLHTTVLLTLVMCLRHFLFVHIPFAPLIQKCKRRCAVNKQAVLMVLLSFKMCRHVWNNMESAGERRSEWMSHF